MSDEQEPIAAELETPAITPAIEPEEVPELPVDTGAEPEAGNGDDDTGDGGEPAEPEFVTLERNGKQYQVPKELEGELLMHADYTKKTQTVAEKAKELDAREAQITQQADATEAELDARAELKSVNAQIEAYAKLTQEDWDFHENQDPLAVRKAERHYQFLKEQKAALEGTVNGAQTERTEKAQQDLAKRVQETTAFAQKEIPGWKPELTDKLVKLAIDVGVPEDAIKANWSPVFYKLLHQAYVGDLAMKQQAAPKPSPKPPVTPLVTVRAASNPAASRTLADIARSDDMEAYAAARRAGKTR